MQEEDGGGSQKTGRVQRRLKQVTEGFKLYDERSALLTPDRLPDYEAAQNPSRSPSSDLGEWFSPDTIRNTLRRVQSATLTPITPIYNSFSQTVNNLYSPALITTPALTRRSSLFIASKPDPDILRSGTMFNLGLNSPKQRHDPTKMTKMQAGFNVFNIYVGLTLLSVGYAVVKGGLSAFGLCMFIMLIGNWSGVLLVRCFAKLSNCKGESAYCLLGQEACGRGGLWAVAAAIMLEFFGMCINCFIFLWRHLALLFPKISLYYIIVVSSAALLPSVWLLDMSQLSFLSILGTVSSIATVLITLIVFIWSFTGDYSEYSEGVTVDTTLIYPENYGLASGIFLFALAGHGCLPSVYNNMQDPEEFAPMLNTVFIIMTILYLVTAAIIYTVYGTLAEVLMTQNFATWPGGWIVTICITLIVAKLCCTLSPCVHVFSEIPEEFLHIHSDRMRRIFRTCVYCASIFSAYICFDHLDIVEAVTGAGCTMCTSVIFPVLFYACLYWKDMTKSSQLFYSSVFVIAILLTIIFLYQDFAKLGQPTQ